MFWLVIFMVWGYVVNGFIGAGVALGLVLMVGWIVGLFINNDDIVEDQILFLNSLFSMLAKMAKADGVVVKDEINAVTLFMDTIKLSDKDKEISINAFRKAVLDKYSIYEYATQYTKTASREMREIAYTVLWEVAYSDGIIYQEEDIILRKIPKYLGLNDNIYSKYSNASSGGENQTSSIDEHYELFGCNKNSSDKEIKKSYKRVISAYHPDKIQSKGLPKEFMDFANKQSKKINKAYEVIKKSRI
jgi:DnaJ like chaperone protein